MSEGKISSLNGEDMGRYIVIGDECIASGPAGHKQLLTALVGTRFGNPTREDPLTIRERIIEKMGANQVDMGFMERRGKKVVIFGKSPSFELPVQEAMPQVRVTARDVLQKRYNREEIEVANF